MPEDWLAALDEQLDRLGRARGEATVLCHSLSCALWLHHAARRAGADAPVARVLLVAPPSLGAGVPAIEPFFPLPIDAGRGRAGGRARRAWSAPTTTRTAPRAAPPCYGAPLAASPTELLPGAGHVNTDAGYGPWPGLEAWCYGAKKGVET